MMPELRITMTFSLNSLYHSTGDRLAFGVDKAIYLDPRDGKTPAIPATSMKGVLRYQIETILRANGNNVCEAPKAKCKDKNDACIVCKIFGSPRIKSPLIFQDVVLKNSTVDSRMGVGIGRRRKTAKEDHLFSYEIGSGNEFSTEINGHFSSEEVARTACALLFLGAKTVFALGSSKSRGLGWMELREFKAFVNDRELTKEEIEKELKGVIKI
jgi:CRISPR type III-B/RAMP module RAMP protein Cmr1